MFEDKLVIVKCLTLLYRENLLGEGDDSKSLVVNALANIKDPDLHVGMGGEAEVVNSLKSLLLDICNDKNNSLIEKDDFLQTIRLYSLQNEKLFKVIEDSINKSIEPKYLKRSILSIKKWLGDYLREFQIHDILNKASYTYKYQRDTIKDPSQFLSEVIAQLEPLQVSTGSDNGAIVDEVDLGNDEKVIEVFDRVKTRNSDLGVYLTGWSEFNDMTSGGIRPGETILIAALQHNYKTGFTLSLFAQLATLNKPLTIDVGKKPLILRISFEDAITDNLQFLYQYLKYNETKERVDIQDIGKEEMASYIKGKLQETGFNVKMLRVDPSQWTYKDICNKVLEYEAQGYKVEILMLDYLAMVPTTGCINSGPSGTDLRDLFRRMRNFTSGRDITLITPTQLSTEAKRLTRSGIPPENFVKEISGKGLFSGSGQLDQEVDLEVYIHIVTHKKKSYLSVQRGKHRLPKIVPESKKYFLLPFPDAMPIVENINEANHSPMRKLASTPLTNANEGLFDD